MSDDDRPWDPTAGPLVPMPAAAHHDRAVLQAWMREELAEQHRRTREWEIARGTADDVDPAERGRSVVVGVRMLRHEQRELVRAARRSGVSTSDLVRRWVRAGLQADRAARPGSTSGSGPDRQAADGAGRELEQERSQRQAHVAAAADAAVTRIEAELRRLRELVLAAG